MGHGKETPRQKMIGMMYLVLTAMLALNVAKEVLDAFVNIDHGLNNSTVNTVKKNQLVYDDFKQRLSVSEAAVRPKYEEAMKIKERADSICHHIYECKKEMLFIIGDTAAIHDTEDGHHEVHMEKIKRKDDLNAAAQVMVGAEESQKKGEGHKLEKEIDEFREYIAEIVSDKDIVKSIKEALNTDPVKHADQEHPWVSANFEHLPIAGVISILSGIENNVRNAEADVIGYLFSQIDAGSFKFNKLEATVIPNSNYIIRGNEYGADIFIAASDSTTKPIVKIGKVNKIENDDGSIDYEMAGSYDSLPIANGRGKYSVSANSLGNKSYEGLIYLKKPMGGFIKKYFKNEYQVAQAQVVISPTKMNVFYSGLENPVEVSVPGVPPDKLQVGMTGGRIYRSGGGYIAKPSGRSSKCVVSVSGEINGEQRRMPSKTFRVKPVPDPIGKFAQTSGGEVRKSILSTARYVRAELPDFLFDLTFKVVSFNMYTVVNGFTVEYPQNGNQISNQQKQLLRNAKPGQRIVIEEIKVKKPDGSVKKLKGAISLKVTQ